MDAIKKKMLAMKMDKENALDRAEQMEQKLRDTDEQKIKLEEDLNTLQKKYANLENEYDKANEGLIEANTKLEASEKRVSEAPELDEPSTDPGATGPYPRAETPPRASTPTCSLAFTTPPGSGGDPRRLSGGVFVVGGGGKARESSLPVELFASDYLGADLSQDSQLSASTLSLSQELSQGSLVDPAAEESAAPPASTAGPDGAKAKKKGSKKGKKKKVRPKSKESSPRPASSSASHSAAAAAAGTAGAAGATLTDSTHSADGSEGGRCETVKEHRSGSRCAKSSRSERADKKSRTLSRRPEPEGGNSSQPAFSANEYERIINGNEPLFSDLDVSGDDEAKPPPPPRPHRQSRLRAAAAAGGGGGVGGMVGIFIPCTQLGINSNTMIKFAIIGTELQNIFQVSNRLESDLAGLNRRIQLLEEDLERSEERLQTATEKLEEASKAADESERVRRTVENKLYAGDERLEDVETELRAAKQAAQEWEARYEEAARKLTVMESELEKAEDRADSAERRVRELEEQSHALTNNLRSLELCEEKASQREDSYEETIRDLTQRLKDHEARSEMSEREVARLQKMLERMEDELDQQRLLNQKLQEDMDQCIGELQNL